MTISITASIGREREMGINGKVPWRLPEDLRRFREMTLGHPIIMGRKTYESIGHPLVDRKNIIITRDPNFQTPEGAVVVNSFQTAVEIASNEDSEVFVIGGAEIYALALSSAKKMYLTHVDYHGPADTYFPDFDLSEWNIVTKEIHQKSEPHQYNFEFVVYQRKTD